MQRNWPSFRWLNSRCKPTNCCAALVPGALRKTTLPLCLAGSAWRPCLLPPSHFDGNPVTIAPNPLTTADSAFLVAYGPDGAEIDRQQIPISPESIQWDGIAGVDGSTFPTGNYTFEIESYDGETLLLAERAQTYGRVTEARIEEGQTVLILKGSLAVLADNVTGLREPG